MQAVQAEALDPEQAQTFLAVQAARHRTNLEQLQVFKGRHLMAQECYRLLIERLAKSEQDRGYKLAADSEDQEQLGLQAACAIVGEAVQEAHGMMLQQAGSVRENEAMSILMHRRLEVFAQQQEAQRQADAQQKPTEAEPAEQQTMAEAHAAGAAEDHLASSTEGGPSEPEQVERVEVPTEPMPERFETDAFKLVGKTVGQAIQQARPGRRDWKAPSWMADRRTGALKGLP